MKNHEDLDMLAPGHKEGSHHQRSREELVYARPRFRVLEVGESGLAHMQPPNTQSCEENFG
jgi:hypothetical protein